ncbi:hypothetical protein AVL56_02600 [Alteromonas stellipolaris]|nr:hypothetical protein AVL56_02600 [Alteromonas stellipolaris]
MKNGILGFCCIFIVSCASTPTNIDVDYEFDRLYQALEISDTVAYLMSREFLYQEGESNFFAESDEKFDATNEDQDKAKQAFKAAILKQLTSKEIKAAADFYSTKAGINAHKAIVEAENAVSVVLGG